MKVLRLEARSSHQLSAAGCGALHPTALLSTSRILTSLVLAIALLFVGSSVNAQLTSGQLRLVERYSKTLKKSRKAKERRDAARSLGKLKGVEAVEPLIGALSDKDATVRRQAADALWRLRELAAPAESALRAVLDDPSPGVRVRAAAALERLGVAEEELVEARVAGLEAEKLRDRILASRDLVGFVSGAKLLPPILEVAAAEADTHESDLGEKYLSPVSIIERLVRAEDTDFLEPLLLAVQGGNPGRRFLLQGLEKLEPKPEGWNELLTRQLQSDRPADRKSALSLLGARTTDATGVDEWIEPVIAALSDPDTQMEAIWSLRRAKGAAAAAGPKLAELVAQAPKAMIRKSAAAALEEIGDRAQAYPSEVLRQVALASLPALCAVALNDSDEDVRGAALAALHDLRVSADEVLPTFVKAATDDPYESNRFKSLQYIRVFGTDATSAIPDLEAIIANDPGNRGMAEQALNAVKTREPDFTLESTTSETGGGSAQALSSLRAIGVDYTRHMFYRALSDVEIEKVQLFLDAGMAADERVDDVGMRPLHVLFFGSPGCSLQERPTPEATKEITKLLLERGADPSSQDDRGNTVLKLAALACDADVIRLLLAAGADMNAIDMHGMTSFEMTLWSATDAADAFLEAGFKLTPDKVERYLEAYKDNPGAVELIKRATPVEAGQ